MLIFHVLIAIASLVASTYVVLRPSRAILRGSLGLIALTVASGTDVAFTTHVSLLHLCLSGLTYSALTLALQFVARRRLASGSLLTSK